MNKQFMMERQDDKETKGTYRYSLLSGDLGVTTIYVRKESLCADQPAPRRIMVTIEDVHD